MRDLETLETLTILVLLAVGVYLGLSALALGPAFVPAILHEDYFILAEGVGWSMYPYIKNGDLLVVDVTPESIDIGDVIVYKYKGELIGHRVMEILPNGYIVKGDNNPSPDPLVVSDDMIIGEVENVISNDILKYIAKMWFEQYQ